MTLTQQDPAQLRLVAGRALAVEKQPYLGTALFAMTPVRESRARTLAVDDRWRMYWSPEFVMTMSVEECAGAWLHEVGHLLRHHGKRFEATLEPRNRHPLWNRAGDAAINQDLREASIALPPIKAVYPEYIPGAAPGMTTEQMYRLILNTPDADKVETQKELIRLIPGMVLTGKTDGQRIIGITRAGFLDRTDLTITVTDAEENPVAVRDEEVHDRRTLSFVLAEDLGPGQYPVTVTSGTTTVQTALMVVAPSITFRPDHLTRGWVAPHKVTVVGRYTNFTAAAVVTMTDADDTEVQVSATEHISREYLNFEIREQVPDGVYRVTVTEGSQVLSAMLPIGMPFMDIVPGGLPVGHGTPYPFAAVVSDFTFDATTTMELFGTLMGVPVAIPNAFSGLTVKTPTTADFTLTTSLPEGQYLVVATTGTEQAIATLSVSNDPGDGEDDGSGEGEGEGEGKGKGKGQGQGQGEGDDGGDGDGDGDGEGGGSGQGSGQGGGSGQDDTPFDDCGSGVGGGPRPWDRGDRDDDGSVDEGRGNLIREQVARDIDNYARTRGTVPGGWTRWAKTVLEPQVDWRKELRSVVRRTAATVAGMRDYTYTRPSRRAGSVPNVVLPAMRAPRPARAAGVVDTSGSVSDRMLGQAIGDIKSLLNTLRAAGGDGFKLIACDAAAAEMQSVRSIEHMTLSGGGGTDMRIGIEAAAAITPKADIIITFTDGETPWPDEPPAANPHAKYVAVLLAGDTSDRYPIPDFIHKIVVDEAYLRAEH